MACLCSSVGYRSATGAHRNERQRDQFKRPRIIVTMTGVSGHSVASKARKVALEAFDNLNPPGDQSSYFDLKNPGGPRPSCVRREDDLDPLRWKGSRSSCSAR